MNIMTVANVWPNYESGFAAPVPVRPYVDIRGKTTGNFTLDRMVAELLDGCKLSNTVLALLSPIPVQVEQYYYVGTEAWIGNCIAFDENVPGVLAIDGQRLFGGVHSYGST